MGRSKIALLAILLFAIPAQAQAAGSPASEVKSVCPAPEPHHATCFAKVLINKKSKHPVRPHPHKYPVKSRLQKLLAPEEGTPAYFQQVYDLTYLSNYKGFGDTVGIVDSDWDENATSDLAYYRKQYGLPACTIEDGCFRQVNQEGSAVHPKACVVTEKEPCSMSETSLDLDAVSAICPNCHIILVEANSSLSTDLAAADKEADTLGANQISDSFGVPSTGEPNEEDIGNQEFSFPGVATVASSGDTLYEGNGINTYPAALSGVTSVGGTTLLSTEEGPATARGWNETVWNNSLFGGTNSGCDLRVPKPAWQSELSCQGRAYNDISADGDSNSGLDVYNSQNGGWEMIGGTSLSAPLVAAYYALVGGGAGDGGGSWAYSNRSYLNAIIQGNDIGFSFTGKPASCEVAILYICEAGNGYNGPGGNGSISGDVVPGAPGIGGPSKENNYTVNVSSDSATLFAGVYPNQKRTEYWWDYGSHTYEHTTKPVTITRAPLSGSGGIIPVTSHLKCLLPGKAYQYRLIARNQLGTTYGYNFSFITKQGNPSKKCKSQNLSS